MKKKIMVARAEITPATASIVLIAGTLVLALAVGAYTFGVFGGTVKTDHTTESNGAIVPANYTGIVQGYAKQVYYESLTNNSVINLSVSSPCPGDSSPMQILSLGPSASESIVLGDVILANYSLWQIQPGFADNCGYSVISWSDLSR